MRLSEPIEEQGFFWRPQARSDWLSGTLRVFESGRVDLKMIMPPNVSDDSSWHEFFAHPNATWRTGRIIGVIKGKRVVLEDCYCIRSNMTTGLGISELTFLATFGFLVSHSNYGEHGEIRFTEVRFAVERFYEWLWGPEDNLEFDLPGHKMKFALREKSYISLRSEELRPLGDFLPLVEKIGNFLRFAINQPVALEFMTGYTDEITYKDSAGTTHELSVNIYREDRSPPDTPAKPVVANALFMYRHIAGRFEEWLKEWLRAYEGDDDNEDADKAFYLYFVSQHRGSDMLEEQFSRLAKAMEVLYDQNVLGLAKAEKIGERAEFLKIIRAIFEPFRDLYDAPLRDKDGNEKDFAEWVRSTRNYLTHYSRTYRDEAASGQELYLLHLRLESLFQLSLLKRMGADEEFIRFLIGQSWSLRRKIEYKILEVS